MRDIQEIASLGRLKSVYVESLHSQKIHLINIISWERNTVLPKYSTATFLFTPRCIGSCLKEFTWSLCTKVSRLDQVDWIQRGLLSTVVCWILKSKSYRELTQFLIISTFHFQFLISLWYILNSLPNYKSGCKTLVAEVTLAN